MVLLDIKQEAMGERVDGDQLLAALARELEGALLGPLDSAKTAGPETGYWSYSMPSPGVRYYAFNGRPQPKSTGSPTMPKAAPRYGAGSGLPR